MYQHQNSSFDVKSNNSVKESADKLSRLAKLINWRLLSDSFTSSFQSSASPSPRMIFALLYLQAKEDISSDELMERWLVTPEWQYFCGVTELQDTYPVHPSSLSIWGREIGVRGSKLMCAALSPSFTELRVH